MRPNLVYTAGPVEGWMLKQVQHDEGEDEVLLRDEDLAERALVRHKPTGYPLASLVTLNLVQGPSCRQARRRKGAKP